MIRISGIELPLQNKVICQKEFIILDSKITCICGISGSGKTTLLYLLGLLDDTKNCCYEFDGKEINLNNDYEKSNFRKSKIGYVFQDSNLISHLSIKENWELAASISGRDIKINEIVEMLNFLELSKTGNEKISQLSGGEKQRVAIGMALIKKPRLLLLDEPTSSLDKLTAEGVISLIKKISLQNELMVVIASHSKNVIENSDVIYEIINNEITCLQDTIASHKKVISLFSPTKFSALKYVIQFYTKHKVNKAFISLLCSLVIALFVLSTAISSQIIDKQQESLSTLVNTQIIVSNNPTAAYYDPKVECFNEETYKKIIQLEHVKDYMPVVAVQTYISDYTIDVLPYNTFMGPQEFKSGKSIYISYDLKEIMLNNDLPFDISLDFSFQNKIKNANIRIEGAMKSTYSNTLSKNKYVIYIEENVFYQMFSELIDFKTYIPNTIVLYVDYYSNINQVKRTLLSIVNQGSIDNEYADLSTFNESTKTFSTYLKIVSISLCLLLSLMLVLIFSRYLMNREYEFCILKANGLTKKEINLIICYDILIQALLFMLCSFIYVSTTGSILKYLQIIDQIDYLKVFLPISLVSLGVLVAPLMISLKNVNRFSPARFLRR